MQENDIIPLLLKKFAGELEPESVPVLEDWLRQSPKNAALAEQYRLLWEKAGSDAPHSFTLDMDAEFRQLQQKIKTAEKPPTKTVPLPYRLLRIAAAIAFLLTAGWWAYRQTSAPAPLQVAECAATLEKRQVDLPDGTRVWLRKNASLTFPKSFEQHERRVKLTGEAYFEVAHKKDQPFRIELSQAAEVEVLGTRFNVKDLPGENETSVLVRDGRVRFSPIKGEESPVLTAGQQAVYKRAQSQLLLSQVTSFNALSWQTGGLEFVNTPLRDVVTDLEKYYQVKIELRNPALGDCPYTAPLTRQPVEQVLQTLTLIYEISVEHPTPGRFILNGGICKKG